MKMEKKSIKKKTKKNDPSQPELIVKSTTLVMKPR
jgi:hypothetical protein